MRLILWIFSVAFIGFSILKDLALIEVTSILGYLLGLPSIALGSLSALIILVAGYAVSLDIMEAQKW